MSRTFKDSVEILDKLVQATINGKTVPEFFVFEGKGYWQVFRHSMLLDIKREAFTGQSVDAGVSLKDLIISGLLVVYSLASLVVNLFWEVVLVYTNDIVLGGRKIDPRIAPVYESLNDRRFLEFIHFVPSRRTLENFWKRQRPAVYIEALDAFITLFTKKSTAVISAPNQEAAALLKSYLRLFEIRKKRLTWIRFCMSLTRAKVLFLIDDVRSYHEVLIAAHEHTIQSYGTQHGHFTKYHLGWLSSAVEAGEVIRPKQFLLWSDYWRKELLQLGTYFRDSELVIGGMKRPPATLIPLAPSGEKLTVLFVFETEAPFAEVKKYLELFKADPRYEVAFKPRQDQPLEPQLEKYGLQKSEVSIFSTLEDSARKAHLIVGTYSTILYEYIELGVPTALLVTSSDFGEGLVRNDLSELLTLENMSYTYLCKITAEAVKKREERSRRLIAPGKIMKETIKEILKG